VPKYNDIENGNGGVSKVWQVLMGIALTIAGAAIMLGINHISNKTDHILIKIDKICDKQVIQDNRVAFVEVMMTMSYDERAKVLQRIKEMPK